MISLHQFVRTLAGHTTIKWVAPVFFRETMEAMACTQAVTPLPVLQPLIGMDKEEIVTIARRIGTLETSILPYEDCCTVFTPKHPKTKPTLGQVLHAERNLDREALITKALESVEKVKVSYHDEPLL